MEDGTYRNTEFCQHYRDWAQALKRNYEAVKAEQSTVSPARDLSTSTRTAQGDPYAQVATMCRWSVADDADPGGAKPWQGERVKIWT
jgi:hypothetical protein